MKTQNPLLKIAVAAEQPLIILDFRGKIHTNATVTRAALKQLTGQTKTAERDTSKRGETGHILWGNMLHIAEVVSLAPSVYVAGLRKFTATESRKLVKNYLAKTP